MCLLCCKFDWCRVPQEVQESVVNQVQLVRKVTMVLMVKTVPLELMVQMELRDLLVLMEKR